MSSNVCNKDFASDYMLLNPEKVGLRDLYHIIFAKDLETRGLIDRPEGTDDNISSDNKWIIAASIVLQKVLLSTAKPLASFGSGLEYWLNLLSSNDSFFGLIKNFLRGKVIRPDEDSATFLSFTGNMDKRVKLDESIKPGDIRYVGLLSIMAAKASYENKAYLESTVNDHWKMDLLGTFNFWNDYQEKATTQAFVCRDQSADNDLIVVAFRGTETFDADAWISDVDLSWYELCGMGRVHGGFMKALGLQKSIGWPNDIQKNDTKLVAYYHIRDMLKEILQTNENAKFILTGHSLGGALAVLFPAILAYHKEELLLERLQGIYTFGQPRVGDENFGEYMQGQLRNHGIQYVRYVYCNDIVPRLPYDNKSFMFKHFGTCLYFNSLYNGKIVAEEPNKNYFSILYVIPKVVNAIWELIRSFVISHWKGPDYSEPGILRVLRVIGLGIPGVPAHMPKDYINSTLSELPSDIFLQIEDQTNGIILQN